MRGDAHLIVVAGWDLRFSGAGRTVSRVHPDMNRVDRAASCRFVGDGPARLAAAGGARRGRCRGCMVTNGSCSFFLSCRRSFLPVFPGGYPQASQQRRSVREIRKARTRKASQRAPVYRFGSVSTSRMTGTSIASALVTASRSSCGRVTRMPAPPQISA
jgi:hypothetical protein